MKRSSFAAVLNYIVRPDHRAELLHAEGVMSGDVSKSIKSFDLQAMLNPRIRNPVLHCSFSFALQDNVTPEQMVACVKRWQYLMGYDNTQLIIYQHQDHDYSHCHAVFNRIDNNGKTLSDRNDRLRSTRACKTIINEFGLYIAPGKRKVNLDRLRNMDKAKYDLFIAIHEAKRQSSDWRSFDSYLRSHGIIMRFRLNNDKTRVRGITFSDGNITFAGSRVDKSLSYFQLNRYFDGQVDNQNMPLTKTDPYIGIESKEVMNLLPYLTSSCSLSADVHEGGGNIQQVDGPQPMSNDESVESNDSYFEFVPLHFNPYIVVQSSNGGGGGGTSEYCGPKKKKKDEDEYIEVKPKKRRR